MPREFTKQITVIEPECDITKRMSLANIMRHAQQMGSYHLHEVGIGYNRMYEDGMVFFVSKMLITIHRRPGFDEPLLLTTVPKKPKGAQFIRDTYFDTISGERLVEVSIAWLLVDPQEHKILRPSKFDRYGIEMFPNDGEYITGYRIRRPEGPGERHLRQVKYSDLDYNFHVNNAIYSNIVCDLVPLEILLEREIASFGILYQKEARAGQVIDLELVCAEDGDTFYVGGRLGEARCFESEIKFR